MALSTAAIPPGIEPRESSGGRRARAIGLVFSGLVWTLFVAMALRRSHFPVVLHRYSSEYAALLAIVLAVAVSLTVAQLPRVSRALYEKRYVLVWVLVFCPLFVFFAVEGAMRLFNLLGSSFYSDIRRYTMELTLDDRLYFKNPANYHGEYHGVDITTNELGLRDRPIHAHAPGVARILVLGDSVTFGWGVNVADTFPRRLERELASSTKKAVETINSGVPGYNTSQELTFLELYGERLQSDLVVLVYVDNDIDAIDPARVHMGVLPDPRSDPQGAADYFLSKSRLYFMLRHIVPVVIGGATASPAEKRQSAGWRESMAALDTLVGVCRARGTPLAVFHFRMMDDSISAALNEDLDAHARSRGFVFADTLPWFRGLNIRQLTNSFVDTHPNAAGHAVLAEGMARLLTARGLVAPEAAGKGSPEQ